MVRRLDVKAKPVKKHISSTGQGATDSLPKPGDLAPAKSPSGSLWLLGFFVLSKKVPKTLGRTLAAAGVPAKPTPAMASARIRNKMAAIGLAAFQYVDVRVAEPSQEVILRLPP
jgi:hypothetical protein